MRSLVTHALLAALLAAGGVVPSAAAEKKPKKEKKERKSAGAPGADPYAEYVWPPPPDEPRIKLEAVIGGRADVEATSRFKRRLMEASPQAAYDKLRKPFGVGFDPEGRILVTDWGNAALVRFDRKQARMDVFGTRGAVRLKQPMGLDVGPDGTVYVADVALQKVVAFDPDGKVVAVYGKEGELLNPTDAALSPDGKRLLVADSKAHKVVVFDAKTAAVLSSFGRRGTGDGEMSFPTSLTFGPGGSLFLVDQINSRVQVFDADGKYMDQFGNLGTGFGNFVRPKDVAVTKDGLILVTDNAFNNVQIFDADFALLTFVGEGGTGPGRFSGASGVAVLGDLFAVVDQIGRRVQVFRFLPPKKPS